MNKRLLIISIVLCLVASIFVGNIQAQTIVPGVTPGMTFNYCLSSYWSSSDPFDSIPVELLLVNQTLYVELRISEVNSTHVVTDSMCYYTDGTATFERGAVDLYTGNDQGFSGVIGANLKAGDFIHPIGTDSLTIADTVTRTYEKGDRETNHVHIVDGNKTAGYIGTRDLYFDKKTGILVEQIDQVETTEFPTGITQVTWKLDSTLNVEDWTVTGKFSTINNTGSPSIGSSQQSKDQTISTVQLLLAAVILIIIITVVIIVYKKRKHK
ncbi:MAG: hypothetical protein FWH37_02470 [Candidatus Bathyarchaeota archaeon]|nr:hypothetical protein [Candidatus Termiticorpusculum sp.]